MTHRQARARELEMLRLRLSGMTFSEIAEVAGVTRQRAHQLVRRAIANSRAARKIDSSTKDVRGEVPRRKKNKR